MLSLRNNYPFEAKFTQGHTSFVPNSHFARNCVLVTTPAGLDFNKVLFSSDRYFVEFYITVGTSSAYDRQMQKFSKYRTLAQSQNCIKIRKLSQLPVFTVTPSKNPQK